jgi:DNA-binding GntR family transcriptional regulator
MTESPHLSLATADFSGRIGRVAAPLREQVMEVLRDAILNFQLTPGQRLIERELMDLTGVSRTTIREVLRELSAQGLVTTVPQRGVIVVIPSAEDARELYDIRALLEAELVRLFVQNADDGQVAQLRTIVEDLEAAARAGLGAADVLKAKDLFYAALGKGGGNTNLSAMLSQVQARVSLVRASSLASSEGRPLAAAQEMSEVVRAIEKRDAAAAQAAIRAHVESAARVGLNALSSQAGAVPAGFESRPG